MKKYFITLLAATVLGAASAQAGVSGIWSGQVDFANTWSTEVDATDLSLDLNESTNQLQFSLRFTYPNGQQVQQNMTFEVDGTTVYYNGELVGQLLPDRLFVKDAIIEGGDSYSVTFKKNADGTAIYSDEYCYAGYEEKTCETLQGQLSQQKARALSHFSGSAKR